MRFIFILSFLLFSKMACAQELAPIKLPENEMPPKSFVLSEPKLDSSQDTKKSKEKLPDLRLNKRLGVVDTELKVAPLRRQAQLEGNIDLMRLTRDYRKQKLLRRQCTYNPEKCKELNELILKKIHDEEVSPQIREMMQGIKQMPYKIYRAFKSELQTVEDHDL